VRQIVYLECFKAEKWAQNLKYQVWALLFSIYHSKSDFELGPNLRKCDLGSSLFPSLCLHAPKKDPKPGKQPFGPIIFLAFDEESDEAKIFMDP